MGAELYVRAAALRSCALSTPLWAFTSHQSLKHITQVFAGACLSTACLAALRAGTSPKPSSQTLAHSVRNDQSIPRACRVYITPTRLQNHRQHFEMYLYDFQKWPWWQSGGSPGVGVLGKFQMLPGSSVSQSPALCPREEMSFYWVQALLHMNLLFPQNPARYRSSLPLLTYLLLIAAEIWHWDFKRPHPCGTLTKPFLPCYSVQKVGKIQSCPPL